MMTTIPCPLETSVVIDNPTIQGQKMTILPADILHIAAQFVSRDAMKPALSGISIKPVLTETSGILTAIEICSTDGHRMFRCNIPVENTSFFLDSHIVVGAAAFKKKVGKASTVRLSLDGTKMVSFYGCKDELISASPCEILDVNFPMYNQLWPNDFQNIPGRPISFNAAYLASFLKEVDSCSNNSIATMNMNTPTTPLTFSADHSSYANVKLEYLLMPVQLRV